jgi:dTDP-4-amino-4,6-dideoxygalactose transaminase
MAINDKGFPNNSASWIQQFSSKLDEELGAHAFFYWKGRVALYALLKAMSIEEGDEVILPAYTCVVVPNAILYLGAKPVYVDVSNKSYNMNVEVVSAAITDRTKVIICQNTYGLSSDLNKLQEVAAKHGLYTIEDCTHGFGGQYQGIPNGLSCDAAFFSTQWNKPFSTGIGGFAITNNETLTNRLSALQEDLVTPSPKELINLRVLYFVKRYLINDVTYWSLVRLYRWLSRNNFVVGSSSGEEINSVTMPENYFKAFSNVQAKEGARTLPMLAGDLEERKKNARLYNQILIDAGKPHVAEDLFDDHSFLKYPLLVKNRDKFMALAEKSRVSLGEWFLTPLHPVKGNLSAWGYEYGKYPVAEYLAEHVVNLPTTPSDVRRVTEFLEKNMDEIVDRD